MNWGSIGRGFVSVADDATRMAQGSGLASDFLSSVSKKVGRNLPRVSAQEAADIMDRAQEEAVRFMNSYAARSAPGLNDNPILYNIGRGAANTGQFIKNNAGTALNTGMTAMYVAPMMMSMLPQQQYEEQQYYGGQG